MRMCWWSEFAGGKIFLVTVRMLTLVWRCGGGGGGASKLLKNLIKKIISSLNMRLIFEHREGKIK